MNTNKDKYFLKLIQNKDFNEMKHDDFGIMIAYMMLSTVFTTALLSMTLEKVIESRFVIASILIVFIFVWPVLYCLLLDCMIYAYKKVKKYFLKTKQTENGA